MGLRNLWANLVGDGPTLGLAALREQVTSADVDAGTSRPLRKAYGPDYARKIIVNDQRDGVRTPWIPVRPRWLVEEFDAAWSQAEQGNLRMIAELIEAMRGDGTINGLMKTRCSMARLPTKFEGDPYLCGELQGVAPTYGANGVLLKQGIPGAFSTMCPIPALRDMLFTGIMAGIAVAELIDDPVTGIPVLHPRELYWLKFDWATRQWIYYGGREPYVVNGGDGRWVVWMPDSEYRPWKTGAWLPCGIAYITKLAAAFDRLRWMAMLADPLKYFETTNSLSEPMRQKLEHFLVNLWMRAPGIVLPEGVKAGIVETSGTGRGFDVYQQAEQWGETQIAKALAGGQNVTSEGTGQGFGDGDIFSEIAENILQDTAASFGECITKQVIKPWARRKFPYRLDLNGDVPPSVAWDVRSPARRAMEAEVLGKMSDSVTKANSALLPQRQRIDAAAYFASSGLSVQVVSLEAGEPTPARLLPGTQGSDATMDRAEVIAPPDAGSVAA